MPTHAPLLRLTETSFVKNKTSWRQTSSLWWVNVVNEQQGPERLRSSDSIKSSPPAWTRVPSPHGTNRQKKTRQKKARRQFGLNHCAREGLPIHPRPPLPHPSLAQPSSAQLLLPLADKLRNATHPTLYLWWSIRMHAPRLDSRQPGARERLGRPTAVHLAGLQDTC